MPKSTTEPVSRRTLAKGAAWATPIVLASAVAPAIAVSRCEPRDAPSFSHTESWAIQNPASGKLRKKESNGEVQANGKDYWMSYTTALGNNPAVVKLTGGFAAGAKDDTLLGLACRYQVRVYVSAVETSLKVEEKYRGNIKLTMTLYDPDGLPVQGKRLFYTTDPAGSGHFVSVPLDQEIQIVGWEFESREGVYRFEASFEVPPEGTGLYKVNSRGIGFTSPIFEPI